MENKIVFSEKEFQQLAKVLVNTFDDLSDIPQIIDDGLTATGWGLLALTAQDLGKEIDTLKKDSRFKKHIEVAESKSLRKLIQRATEDAQQKMKGRIDKEKGRYIS
jgi:hypothetical protein